MVRWLYLCVHFLLCLVLGPFRKDWKSSVHGKRVDFFDDGKLYYGMILSRWSSPSLYCVVLLVPLSRIGEWFFIPSTSVEVMIYV